MVFSFWLVYERWKRLHSFESS